MGLQIDPFKKYSQGDRVSAKDLNAVRDVVSKVARSSPGAGMSDGTGSTIQTKRYDFAPKHAVLKVIKNEGSNGVYKVFTQKLDSFSETDGSIKFVDYYTYAAWADATEYTRASYVSNDTEIYWCVTAHTSAAGTEPGTGGDWEDYWRTASGLALNLYEYDPMAALHSPALALNDLIYATQEWSTANAKRWVGFPMSPPVRRARTRAAAGAATTIACNLFDSAGTEITSGLGSNISVWCEISGGGNLNACIPRLADDDNILVTNIQGIWWCTTVFQTTENCVCIDGQATSYGVTNELVDRTYDADTVAIAELADIVGTLINDLTTSGIIT